MLAMSKFASAVAVRAIQPGTPPRSSWFRPGERLLDRIARHRRLSVVLVGLLAFGGSAAVSILVQMPVPRVHDEFASDVGAL
jgi:hypothetical protein